MSWRPEGWENPYTNYSEKQLNNLIAFVKTFGKKESGKVLRASVPLHSALFEAGADAMLEALRKDGTHLDEGTDDARFPTDEPGTEVFIPDDEETKLLRDD